MKKYLPTFLCFIFATVAATGALLARHYWLRARSAERETQPRPPSGVKLSQQEKTYLRTLGDRYGAAPKENYGLRDAMQLLARLNEDLNRAVPAEYSTAKTPWLPEPPRTLATRDLPTVKAVPLNLDKGIIELAEKPALYQYSIRNATNSAVPMPVLYGETRWDEAKAMVREVAAVQDELERAIAVWRFVATHRYHAKPVTEGGEEHDLVKFFACYGYGFCDDASQAVAAVAELCGLKARLWGLEGHVVSEIFAAGAWRLLDADFAVYFHKEGDPRAILGVEELQQDRAGFRHAVELGSRGPYQGDYAEFFVTKADNKPWALAHTAEHRIAHTLQPGERVVFSNFNWGRYFLGAYPQRVPRYLNGYFERPLSVDALRVDEGVELTREGSAFALENKTDRTQFVSAEFKFPFPIVGGVVSAGTPVALEVEENGRRTRLKTGTEVPLDSAMAMVAKEPTTAFHLRIVVPAGKTLRFEHPPRVVCDFQCSENPLVRLNSGANRFRIYTPAPETLSGLVAELRVK